MRLEPNPQPAHLGLTLRGLFVGLARLAPVVPALSLPSPLESCQLPWIYDAERALNSISRGHSRGPQHRPPGQKASARPCPVSSPDLLFHSTSCFQ